MTRRPWTDAERVMRYGSVCSGIEAATVAWHPLGWKPAFFSEIEPFPRAVLAHHYPDVPRHGDFTSIQPGDYAAIDLLVGGTPCQSFSVAGLRGGLADKRGNLALEYLRLADRLRPRWLVWENVPGVLSSNAGRDFGAFLGGLVELGYGFAYRVLDAQYVRVERFPRAVPQRRRRVFVVGYLGDWRRAAAVLLERDCLSGHPAPRREAGQGTARRAASGAFVRGPDVSPAIKARDYKGPSSDGDGDGAPLLAVAHSLRAEGFDASEDGTGRGTPLVPIAFHPTQEPIHSEGVCHALNANANATAAVAMPYTLAIRGRGDETHLEYRQDGTANALLTPNGGRAGIGVGAVAFDLAQITSATNRARAEPGMPASTLAKQSRMHVAFDVTGTGPGVVTGARETDVHVPLRARMPGQSEGSTTTVVSGPMAVRRLTPRECLRLQGFPDDYLDITYRGKPAADGPRYKAIGNSMAVNVMAWIGERIQAVEELCAREERAA
jgi:DNA (cytosine-5)-methyltransferase 1